MEPGPDKYDKEPGFIFGLLLVIIWIALLLFVQGALFPRQVFTQNPFTAWLTLGLIPFVVMIGDHQIYRRELGGIEAVRSGSGYAVYAVAAVAVAGLVGTAAVGAARRLRRGRAAAR